MYQIFIIDDHAALRSIYRAVIELESDLIICGEAETGHQALEQLFCSLPDSYPDVVLLDLALPDISGFAVLNQLRKRNVALPVLVVSGQDELLHAPRSLAAGANGYVDKGQIALALVQAIHLILNGGIYISDRVQNYLDQQQLDKQPAQQ